MGSRFDWATALLLRLPLPAVGFLLAALASLFYGAYEGSRDFADIAANDPTRHQLASRARGTFVVAVALAWGLSTGPGWVGFGAGLLALCAGFSLKLDTRLNNLRELPLTYIGQPGPGASWTDTTLRGLVARFGLSTVCVVWFVLRVLTFLIGTPLAMFGPR